jgi:hypothetical protein
VARARGPRIIMRCSPVESVPSPIRGGYGPQSTVWPQRAGRVRCLGSSGKRHRPASLGGASSDVRQGRGDCGVGGGCSVDGAMVGVEWMRRRGRMVAVPRRGLRPRSGRTGAVSVSSRRQFQSRRRFRFRFNSRHRRSAVECGGRRRSRSCAKRLDAVGAAMAGSGTSTKRQLAPRARAGPRQRPRRIRPPRSRRDPRPSAISIARRCAARAPDWRNPGAPPCLSPCRIAASHCRRVHRKWALRS